MDLQPPNIEIPTPHSIDNGPSIDEPSPTISVGAPKHPISPLPSDESISPNPDDPLFPSIDHSCPSTSKVGPYSFVQPSESPDEHEGYVSSASQGFLSEPLQPKFRSITDIYFESGPPDLEEAHNCFSFAHMIHTAKTYREPATYHQAQMSPQAAYWNFTTSLHGFFPIAKVSCTWRHLMDSSSTRWLKLLLNFLSTDVHLVAKFGDDLKVKFVHTH